jgi:hypothetical protein
MHCYAYTILTITSVGHSSGALLYLTVVPIAAKLSLLAGALVALLLVALNWTPVVDLFQLRATVKGPGVQSLIQV